MENLRVNTRYGKDKMISVGGVQYNLNTDVTVEYESGDTTYGHAFNVYELSEMSNKLDEEELQKYIKAKIEYDIEVEEQWGS